MSGLRRHDLTAHLYAGLGRHSMESFYDLLWRAFLSTYSQMIKKDQKVNSKTNRNEKQVNISANLKVMSFFLGRALASTTTAPPLAIVAHGTRHAWRRQLL